jgi:copper chaperone
LAIALRRSRKSRSGIPTKEAIVVTTQVFSVPDISCDKCKNAIEGALRELPGVRVAAVDVGAARVSVSFENITITSDELASAIEQQGYRVEAVRDGDG